MRVLRRIVVFLAIMIVLTVALVVSTSGQRRVRSVQSGTVYRPVAVRRVYWGNPFYPRYYDPFYDPYFYDPYLRERQERYYREQELRGNERELREHREKYGRDGVITAKEQRELDDDIRDVQKARAKLREYRNYYGRND